MEKNLTSVASNELILSNRIAQTNLAKILSSRRSYFSLNLLFDKNCVLFYPFCNKFNTYKKQNVFLIFSSSTIASNVQTQKVAVEMAAKTPVNNDLLTH